MSVTHEIQTHKGAASGYCGLDSGSKVATANLGSGSASSTTYLAGDQTWKTAGGFTLGSTATGGTTGSVLFIGAGPIVTQDNSNFYYDITNKRLGIGVGAPGVFFDLKGSGTGTFRGLNSAASSSSGGGGFTCGHDGGAALASGDRLAFIVFAGARDAAHTLNNSAGITAYANEAWTGSACGAKMQFEVCPAGSTTRSAICTVGSSGLMLLSSSEATQALGIDGSAARVMGMERASSGAGSKLVVKGGGAQSGGSNLNAGDLELRCGIGTGNGSGNVLIQTVKGNQGSGTTDRSPAQVAKFTGTQAQLSVALRVPRTTVADANYTMVDGDQIIEYTSLTAGRTVTLLAAATAGAGYILIVKDGAGAAGASNITLDGNASETIDGALTAVISTNYGSLTLYCTGSNWLII